MHLTNVSRRYFLAGTAFAAAGRATAQEAAARKTTAQETTPQQTGSTLTAAQIIERIKANTGIPWRDQTVDNIIAGAPDTPVHGIASTMMATLDVIQRAAAAGRNMVIK